MSEKKCFHCSLPIINTPPPFFIVFEKKEVFCCHGCQAVCEAIVTSGNTDYYKLRSTNGNTFEASGLNEILERLKLYDDEKLQREFVRNDKDKQWKEAWLVLEEIRCAACMWLNEKTLRQLTGVLDVQMDYTGQQTKIRWDPNKIKLSEIIAAITNIGYHAYPFDPSQRESLNKEQKERSIQRIIFALVLGMAVMQSAIAGYLFGEPNQNGDLPLWITISRWSSIFATATIILYSGQLFFKNAWRDLKNKTLGMDVPIAIGLSVAWFGSLYSTINNKEDVYFESIAMFVIFLLIARHIELKSRISATALLDRASKIIPQTTQLLHQEKLEEVPVIKLKSGDRIQISPGDIVPVDSMLISSKSSFDESLITGESLPVTHISGDRIIGGSINVEQVIELEVIAEKAESMLNEIHQLTQSSINHRPYYVDIAEKVAGKFVAIILIIAFATWSYWTLMESPKALSTMIAVLIVTCPCALALAAPVALSLGAGRLSKMHVLPIRMSAIEKISQVKTLIFDKTGTLTTGIPIVKSITAVNYDDKDKLLHIASRMEQGSKHPFAKAILSAAKETNLELKNVLFRKIEHTSGAGVKAQITESKHENEWRLGNRTFCLIKPSDMSKEIQEQIEVWRAAAYSVLYLCKNRHLQAVFCISDPLRDNAEEFIQKTESLGITRKIILSGDHQQSTSATAKKLAIKEAYGGLSPIEKLNWINELRSQESDAHSKILMLGDGINDAPIMAAADVSMTFSDATDLAKSNCDFILLSKDLKNLSSAFILMRKTRNIIIQNLGWAVIYNLIAIPAAVLGLITPWMAAIGMSLSSLLVVLNSLRLNK